LDSLKIKNTFVMTIDAKRPQLWRESRRNIKVNKKYRKIIIKIKK